jgi:hypothetical protein
LKILSKLEKMARCRFICTKIEIDIDTIGRRASSCQFAYERTNVYTNKRFLNDLLTLHCYTEFYSLDSRILGTVAFILLRGTSWIPRKTGVRPVVWAASQFDQSRKDEEEMIFVTSFGSFCTEQAKGMHKAIHASSSAYALTVCSGLHAGSHLGLGDAKIPLGVRLKAPDPSLLVC